MNSETLHAFQHVEKTVLILRVTRIKLPLYKLFIYRKLHTKCEQAGSMFFKVDAPEPDSFVSIKTNQLQTFPGI